MQNCQNTKFVLVLQLGKIYKRVTNSLDSAALAVDPVPVDAVIGLARKIHELQTKISNIQYMTCMSRSQSAKTKSLGSY